MKYITGVVQDSYGIHRAVAVTFPDSLAHTDMALKCFPDLDLTGDGPMNVILGAGFVVFGKDAVGYPTLVPTGKSIGLNIGPSPLDARLLGLMDSDGAYATGEAIDLLTGM